MLFLVGLLPLIVSKSVWRMTNLRGGGVSLAGAVVMHKTDSLASVYWHHLINHKCAQGTLSAPFPQLSVQSLLLLYASAH